MLSWPNESDDSYFFRDFSPFALFLAKGETITNDEEQGSWGALLPIVMTVSFYLLPHDIQQSRLIQFLPQLSAYCALGIWWTCNTRVGARLGLQFDGLLAGTTWGMLTGLFLGGVNTCVILWVVPNLGGDIAFLRETPHAKVPTWIMMPWGILVIAALVELNFRGFLLGRLQRVFGNWFSETSSGFHVAGSLLAVVSSALVFAFDPFMVSTFRHLHWIAVWDGLIWGVILVRTRNLYAVVVAHAVEVMILYVSIKAVLT